MAVRTVLRSSAIRQTLTKPILFSAPPLLPSSSSSPVPPSPLFVSRSHMSRRSFTSTSAIRNASSNEQAQEDPYVGLLLLRVD